jgi:hypothetical protein
MSEGARQTEFFRLTFPATERSSDGPDLSLAAGPERADEGAWPDAGASFPLVPEDL